MKKAIIVVLSLALLVSGTAHAATGPNVGGLPVDGPYRVDDQPETSPFVGGLAVDGPSLSEERGEFASLLPVEGLDAGEEEAYGLLEAVWSAEDFETQVTLIERAAEAAPGNLDVLFTCAQLLYYLDLEGLYSDECEAMLQDIIAADSPYLTLPAMQLLAELLIYEGRPDEAITLIAEAAAENPDDVDFEVTLATVLYYAGEYADALLLLEEILEDSPESLEAARLRAAILSSEYEYEEALNAYKQIARQFPEYLDGLVGQFQVYLASGDFARAIRTIDELLLSGAEETMWVERARIRLWNLYDPGAALSEVSALLNANPDWIDAYAIQLGALLMLEDYEGAYAVAEQLASYDAAYGATLKGIVAMNEGSWALAEEVLAGLAEQSDNINAYKYQALLRMEAYDDLAGATEAFGKAFQISEAYSDSELFMYLGHLYRREGNLLEAARAYAEADRLTYDDPAPLYYLVMVCGDAGRKGDMLGMLAEMDRRYPGWYDTTLAHVLVEDILGNAEAAMSAFDALAGKFPFMAENLTALHCILLAKTGDAEGLERMRAWIAEEGRTAQDYDHYAYTLLLSGNLEGAKEALGAAEEMLSEETDEAVIRSTRVSVETTRAELLLLEGDTEGCIEALKAAIGLGWPPAALALYDEFAEVYASDAYQALLPNGVSEDEIWDLSVYPTIPE